MGEFLDTVRKRVVEISALQGQIQARADTEKAALQTQIDTLLEIDAAMTKEPALEALYVKARSLALLLE